MRTLVEEIDRVSVDGTMMLINVTAEDNTVLARWLFDRPLPSDLLGIGPLEDYDSAPGGEIYLTVENQQVTSLELVTWPR